MFIERTLQSVVTQSAPGLEIEHVVFDGGSSDNTIEILERFNPPLRWVSECDSGQANAINKGIRATSGEIIGWLNSDDIYYPGALVAAAEIFRDHPEADVVYGCADHIDEEDRVIDRYPTEPWDFKRLTENCILCQPAVFFRRLCVESWGLLDERLHYCMDYEYWIRLARSGARFYYLSNRKLAGSRLHAETKTLGARLKVHAEINTMLRRSLSKTPTRWLFNYAHAVTEDRLRIPRAWGRCHLTARVIVSLWSALKWNHRIGVDHIRLLYEVFLSRLKHFFIS
jgi:glycosyltransferase involved in cell wall biosynthesis